MTIIRCALCGALNGHHFFGCEKLNHFQVKEAPIKHNHYHKDVSHLKSIDVYRVLDLFGVTDQVLGHAIKKLLVAGGRGAGKDINRDVKEAVDSLVRWEQMQNENCSNSINKMQDNL